MKILVVEDEQEIRELLVEQFGDNGMAVESLESGEGVINKLNTFAPEVIVIDQMMPGRSGQEVIQEIRKNPRHAQLPIIVLTGLTSEDDKVHALKLGADDYVTKPFSIKELIARVQALYRRSQGAKAGQAQQITYRDILVDLSAHRVFLKGEELHLTLTEYRILVELMRIPGQVLTRDGLRERAMGNLNVSDRTIDVHMASLRRKLIDIGDDIQTVRGVGYRLPA